MPILGIMASQISGHLNTNSYESIATVTVGTATPTISFSSIPGTYKHLQLRGLIRSTHTDTTDMPWIRINGSSTGASYDSHSLSSSGGTAYGGNVSDGSDSYIRFQRMAAASNTAGIFSVFVMDILDYQNTNKYKVIRALGGNDTNSSDGWVYVGSGMYQSASAITSLSIGCSANFAVYSQIALYGIKG